MTELDRLKKGISFSIFSLFAILMLGFVGIIPFGLSVGLFMALIFVACVVLTLLIIAKGKDENYTPTRKIELSQDEEEQEKDTTAFAQKIQSTIHKLSDLIEYHQGMIQKAEDEKERLSTHLDTEDHSKTEIMQRLAEMQAKWTEKQALFTRRLQELQDRKQELVIIQDLHESEQAYRKMAQDFQQDRVEEDEVLLTSLVDAFGDTVIELSQIEDESHFDEYRHELDELSRRMQRL